MVVYQLAYESFIILKVMITLSVVLLAHSPHEQYFDAFRHKVIAFVCISSKISLINFKCVYSRSHLSSPQSYRCTPKWNATEAFRFTAKGEKKSLLKLRHKIATGYEASGVWLSALHTCCVACLSATEAATRASNRVSEACIQFVKK